MKKREYKQWISNFLLIVILVSCFSVFDYSNVKAADYTNNGCVRWVKDRASSKLGITLPATGQNKYGLYGANNYWYTLNYSKGSEPRANSLAIWEFNNGSDGQGGKYGHVAFVESVDGNNVTVSEGGCRGYSYAGNTGVICRTQDKSKMATLGGCSGFLGYVYLVKSVPQISYNPEGNLESIEGGLNGVSIRGWVFDRDSLSSSVPIHVYMDGVYAGAGVADQKRIDVNSAYGCGGYHGFDIKLPIKSSGTHAFEVYAINIGADGQPSGQGNLLMGGTSVSIVVDETPPVISDVRILDRDSTGYTIECKATDNRGIDRVQCPTWTVANGQDDLQKDWWTDASVKATDKGNGVFQFRVNISEHNSERGQYITHIYAYDEAGNYAVHKVEDVEVLEDSGTITPGDINQDGKIDGKDISMLLQYRLKKRELTEAQIAAGDVYEDGKIDGKDVSRLLQYRLGKTATSCGKN